MPFKPGQSGNPGGRPHGTRDWEHCVRAAGNIEDPKKRRRLMQLAAEQLWRLAAYEGDIQALKEVGDRIDGKPKQVTEIGGPDGGAISMVHRIERVIIDPANPDSPSI